MGLSKGSSSLWDGEGVYAMLMLEKGEGGIVICVGRAESVEFMFALEEESVGGCSSDEVADEPVLDTKLPMRKQKVTE